ncbi:MAG: ABC transporter ATP-binding protein [Promethearchaeota archaeon]
MENIIEIRNLSKNYGTVKALDNVTLSIPKGSIFGYLGPNGAGKTTTLKILVGLLRYSQGSVKIFGNEVKKNSVEVNRNIGFLPDAEMPRHDSIYRFLNLTGKLHKITNRKERISEVLVQVGMKKLCKRKIGSLSKGQKQRVGIANALMVNPQLLILDEPNNGLDPIARVRVLTLLKDLVKNGKTVFLSSHIIGEVDKIATNIAIIHQGRIIEKGERKNLVKRYLNHSKYIVAGKIDKEIAMRSLEYITSCQQDHLERYMITTSGNVTEEQLLVDLIQKANSKIKYFSSEELSLEDLFLETINGQLKKGDYA